MKTKPIIIIWGEPNSIFSEIFIKSLNNYKSKKQIILIGSKDLLIRQLDFMKINYNKNSFQIINKKFDNLKSNKINIIDVKYAFTKPFEKITSRSNKYINDCFNIFFEIYNKIEITGLITGPVSKKSYLKNKFQGITEFLAYKYRAKDTFAMLIYNENLSVSPLTTHLPIKLVVDKISKKKLIKKIILINNFYKNYLSIKPRIGVCGLNPHCENFLLKKSEEDVLIKPAIKYLKKIKLKIYGPFAADTIFLKSFRKEYDVIIGMYHDQVLTPIKTIYDFKAINITLGLPFLRISPDHGPNETMIGKNKSDPKSLINSIKFLNKKF